MSHSHDHHGGQQPNWAERGLDLIADGEVNAPMVDQALRWLADRVPKAELVLDVGGGPGVAACTLARLLPDARVLVLDGAPELLKLAAERAGRLGLGDRFGTRGVTLPDGLATLPPADLIWVSGVVHHLPDPAAAVRDLAGRLRPGGVLALREGGLPLRFLPADRGLAARMNAINDVLSDRKQHPMGAIDPPRPWPDLLREAGLTAVVSRTFLLDLPAPLDDQARIRLQRNLRLGREMTAELLSAEDLAMLDRLTDDNDPESVLHRPDVFMLRASTIHTGVAA
jgi:SAM-dependent methyltransferase